MQGGEIPLFFYNFLVDKWPISAIIKTSTREGKSEMARKLSRWELEMKIDTRRIVIYPEDPTKIQTSYWPIDEEEEAKERALIIENKAEILAILREREAIKKLEEESGYNKIAAAREANLIYLEAVNEMAESGNSIAPKSPKISYADLAKQYPVGAILDTLKIMAESYNYVKSEIGRRSIVRLVNGDDPETVLKEANAEWAAESTRLVWND